MPSEIGNLDVALDYVRRGWAPIPLCWADEDGNCGCGRHHKGHDVGKVPLLGRGYQDLCPTEADMREWWGKWPKANVGLLLEPSGLLFVGPDTSDALALAQTKGLPPTVVRVSDHDGLLYARPPGCPVATVKHKDGAVEMDIKTNGYAVVYGRHSTGKAIYLLEHYELALAPSWAAEMLHMANAAARQRVEKPTAGATAPIRLGEKASGLWDGSLVVDRADGKLKAPPLAQKVDRSGTLGAIAGELFKAGATLPTIVAALAERDRSLGFNKYVDRSDGGTEEYERLADKALRGEFDQKRSVGDLHCTDLGNAQRLVARHGADLRYCQQRKQWYAWDGRRWAPDDTGEVYRRAQETVRAMYLQAADESDHDQRERLATWALRSEGRDRIEAMIALARSMPEVAVKASQLDSGPWLLNCLNGTLDLRSGKLRPHRKEDLITKLCPVEFNPGATLTLWDRFLEDVTGGDVELAGFLQRATGYSLTGDTREEVLFFGHGPTASGKSTFIEAVKAAVGDYSTTADFETFLVKASTGGPRNDVARLAGARLVASVEVDEGKKLAEGLIKTLTGGDTVAARRLYQEAFEFKPHFKLWLIANDPPRVRDDDEALWRRILRVPFVRSIPKERRDSSVKATLRDPKVAGPAILAWAVNGCLAWQNEWLRPPKVVLESTDSYRRDMDPLRPFLEERCVLDPDQWTPSTELHQAYEQWAKANGEMNVVAGKAFSDRLRVLGCTSTKGRIQDASGHSLSVWGWQGIGLSP